MRGQIIQRGKSWSGRFALLFYGLLILALWSFVVGLIGELMVMVGGWLVSLADWWDGWVVYGLRVRTTVGIAFLVVWVGAFGALFLYTFVLEPVLQRIRRR